MAYGIYYHNEIEIAKSLRKTSKTDYKILGEEGNYLCDILKKLVKNSVSENQGNFCVVVVLYGAENKDKLLAEMLSLISEKKCEKCIICAENSLAFSDKDYLVSEREYIFLADDKTVIEKAKQIADKVPTSLLIFDEIIGPSHGFEEIFSADDNKIIVQDNDFLSQKGYTYIRDALSAIFMNLKSGNIYNVSSFSLTEGDIKLKVSGLFSEYFLLKCDLSTRKTEKFKQLCSLKIRSAGLETTDEEFALSAIVSDFYDFEYDYKKNLPQYCSKLDILKKTEMEILSEIDRICKENDIKYFLTGGSLLGAVRYGKSIPWDDDLDIGMLREDFEKFRKICPVKIDKSRFAYASYTTEENCHYLFDKIRLKNTYFSTKFSSQYKIEDGVFVDVFVYDMTSPDKKKQSLHINLVKSAIRFLNLKWTGKADKTMNGYRLTRLVSPVIKRVPFKMLHKFSDNMLMLYNGKKSDYLIDGTGLNINRGAFERSFLENVTEIDFEGMRVPVPEKYDDFLKHVYGENYLSEPAIHMRSGTHDFVRLDLGEYITGENKVSCAQSLDGELF